MCTLVTWHISMQQSICCQMHINISSSSVVTVIVICCIGPCTLTESGGTSNLFFKKKSQSVRFGLSSSEYILT